MFAPAHFARSAFAASYFAGILSSGGAGSGGTIGGTSFFTSSYFARSYFAGSYYGGSIASVDLVGPVVVDAQLELKLNAFLTEVLADGPAAGWRLGEAFGSGTVGDSSGNGIVGTPSGGVTLRQPGATNDGNTAAAFNGVNSTIDFGNDNGFNFGAEFTAFAFVKYTGAGSYTVVNKSNNALGQGWNLGINSNGFVRTWGYDNTGLVVFDVIATTNPTNDDVYHMIAVTRDGTTSSNGVKIYVDGVVVKTGTAVAGITSNEMDHLRIGSFSQATFLYFPGTIDEVWLYRSVLSPARIAGIWAARTVAEWTDVVDDVRGPITFQYGIFGSMPSDRTAGAGSLEFALNNDITNTGHLLGYYSPLHANKRVGFDFNTPTRLKETFGGQTRYKFLGSLADIIPIPGVHQERTVPCVALDWMDNAAQIDLPDLDTQFDQRADELVSTILDALNAADQPTARSIETGSETYEIALDGAVTGQRPKVREILNQVALSELGYVYLKGDNTTGGVLTFESRHHRALNPTVAFTIDDNDILPGDIYVPGSRDDIYSRVEILIRPTKKDPAATTVLFSLNTTHTLLQAGATNDTLFGPYRDPLNNDLAGGTDMVVPVATTDYLMNALEDGSGTDLTANFSVLASYTGLGVRYTIVNNGGTPGYVIKLQARGRGIYRYVLPVSKSVPNSFGTRVYVLDVPFNNSANAAGDMASYIAQQLSRPFARVPSVRFHANLNATFMYAAVLLEPGDRIAVKETVTGVDNLFTINSVRHELEEGRQLYCTFGLEPAVAVSFWLLGASGSSELNETAVLGF